MDCGHTRDTGRKRSWSSWRILLKRQLLVKLETAASLAHASIVAWQDMVLPHLLDQHTQRMCLALHLVDWRDLIGCPRDRNG